MTIVFIGDILGDWDSVARGLERHDGEVHAAILLGNMQCDRPLDTLSARLLERSIAVHWIFGNRDNVSGGDNDGGREMWRNLTDPARNPRTAGGALHGTVTEIEGLRIAGLGGTFRRRIWEPPDEARLRWRAELRPDLSQSGLNWGAGNIDALAHALGATAIWPEDFDRLAAQRADILVTHEAPGSHPAGVDILAGLARHMGARLIVHGHHRLTYRAIAPDGLQAFGVGAGAGVGIDGTVLWTGAPEGDPAHEPGRPQRGWWREPGPDR